MALNHQTSDDNWALVVDDHPLFSDALVLTLNSVADYSKIRTASGLQQALDVIARFGTPKIVVLDLNLPDVKGMDGLQKIRETAQGVVVVIVSSATENRIIHAALQAGAAGFIPKHSSRKVIQEALSVIEAGKEFRPESFVEPNAEADLTEATQRIASLTKQQSRILDLICEGKLNKQIAFELSIAEATVKAHMTAIMRKLGVRSRTQAVLVAQQAKFENTLPTTE